jgi:hypothetical protein
MNKGIFVAIRVLLERTRLRRLRQASCDPRFGSLPAKQKPYLRRRFPEVSLRAFPSRPLSGCVFAEPWKAPASPPSGRAFFVKLTVGWRVYPGEGHVIERSMSHAE